MTCFHKNKTKRIEKFDVYWYCPDCKREFRPLKRRIFKLLAIYMTVTSQGNSFSNFFFGKIESFFKWGLYFLGAKTGIEEGAKYFLGDYNIIIPAWVFTLFMIQPIINLVSDPLLGWILKKLNYWAEMNVYTQADVEMAPVTKEILDNGRNLFKEFQKLKDSWFKIINNKNL